MIAAGTFNRNDAQQFIRNKTEVINWIMKRRSSELQHFAMPMLACKMMLTVIRTNYILRVAMVR